MLDDVVVFLLQFGMTIGDLAERKGTWNMRQNRTHPRMAREWDAARGRSLEWMGRKEGRREGGKEIGILLLYDHLAFVAIRTRGFSSSGDGETKGKEEVRGMAAVSVLAEH